MPMFFNFVFSKILKLTQAYIVIFQINFKFEGYELNHMHFIDYLILVLFFLIAVLEILNAIYNRRNIRDDLDEVHYKKLYRLIYFSLTMGVAVGLYSKINGLYFLYLYQLDDFLPYIGVLLLISGMLIRWHAILFHLKKHFTVNVTIQENHQLVTTGWYRYLRHPAYFGGLLSIFGLGLCYSNWVGFLITFLPYTISIMVRINSEEKVLENQFKEEYVEYRKHTKKIIPFLY
jgi:protein-S-isoprenylcysteine O-methyltransferase Ste14